MTDSPGPAPYIQHQLVAHPVRDQLPISSSSRRPRSSRCESVPPPSSPLDAPRSLCVPEDNDRFSEEGKRCAIRARGQAPPGRSH